MIEPGHDAAPREFHPWKALYQVITEPAATFAALAERPAFLPPYLVQMVVGTISFLALWPLTWAAAMDQVAKAPNAAAVNLSFVRTVSMVSGLVSSLAGPWIIGLIIAGIAAFLGQFYGGSAGFKAYFGMAGYARMPMMVGGLITAAMWLPAKSLQQAQSMSLSLGAFAPDANPYIRGFLTTINPFDLFYYVLLAIGFAALQRMKPARGAAFAIAIYVLGLLITMASSVMARSRGL